MEHSRGRERKGPKSWHTLLGHVQPGSHTCCEVEKWGTTWLTGYPEVENGQLHQVWDAGSIHYISWQNTSTLEEGNQPPWGSSLILLWISLLDPCLSRVWIWWVRKARTYLLPWELRSKDRDCRSVRVTYLKKIPGKENWDYCRTGFCDLIWGQLLWFRFILCDNSAH